MAEKDASQQRRDRRTLAALFALLFAVGIVALNYTGFSYSRLSRISDGEYVAAVIDVIVKHDKSDRFLTQASFREAYPNCCRVLRFDDGMGGTSKHARTASGLFIPSLLSFDTSRSKTGGLFCMKRISWSIRN